MTSLQDEHHHLETKDEEEAIAGLLALGGNDNTYKINLNIKLSEATSSKTEDLVQNDMQIDDPNESRNILDLKKVEYFYLFRFLYTIQLQILCV